MVLCLDEVDQVFEHPPIATDFFGMLRAWHEDARIKPIWKNLRLVIVHSKEVYIPLHINQLPFNVGVPIELPLLTQVQVVDLVQRHGLNWKVAEVERLMDIVCIKFIGSSVLARLHWFTVMSVLFKPYCSPHERRTAKDHSDPGSKPERFCTAAP